MTTSIPPVPSKTAYIRPSKPFALHVVEVVDLQCGPGWALIHSCLPLANGGGQIIVKQMSEKDAREAAKGSIWQDDEVIIHTDVKLGYYDPATNSCLVPA